MRPPAVEHLYPLQMAHEAREILEIPPEAIDFAHGTADGYGALDFDATAGLDNLANRILLRPARPCRPLLVPFEPWLRRLAV